MHNAQRKSMHPQVPGEIERWHQTLKHRILIQSHLLIRKLKVAIVAFVNHLNNQFSHTSI
jgi:putative transposase